MVGGGHASLLIIATPLPSHMYVESAAKGFPYVVFETDKRNETLFD